jgi:hypothetical protein
MPAMAKSANPHDIHSHTLKVVMPEATIDQGGDLTKQPNACNICHYHEDDEPEELQAIVDRIVAEKKGTAEVAREKGTPKVAAEKGTLEP